jgi:predicted SprT family Zn-dependent metalloprotease
LEAIASQELMKHGLRGWTFGWANTKRRLGVCKYQSKRIEIAEYYARNSRRETVLDTLLHEIAHAIAGPAARHGPAWKAAAIRLGATPRACETSREAVVKPGNWQATCPACKETVHLYRRPKSLSGYRCKSEARSPLIFEFMGEGKQTYCQYCNEPMDLGSEFVFLVEAQDYEEHVAPLKLVQSSHRYQDEPLRICHECCASIEQNHRYPAEPASTLAKLYTRALAILFVAFVLCLLYEFIAYQLR